MIKTMDEAVSWVIEHGGPARVQYIMKALAKGDSPDDIAGRAHHGLGQYIRNELHLWADTSADLRQDIWNHLSPIEAAKYEKWWSGKGDFKGRTVHADDASNTILVAVITKVASMGRFEHP